MLNTCLLQKIFSNTYYKNILFLLVFCVSIPICAEPKMGFAIQGSSFSGSYEEKLVSDAVFNPPPNLKIKGDLDKNEAMLGFVIDIPIRARHAKNFSLRVTTGLSKSTPTFKMKKVNGVDVSAADEKEKYDVYGWANSLDLVFGLYKSEHATLWLAPSFYLTMDTGTNKTYSDNSFLIYGFGLGPTAGVDIKLSESAVLALSLGLKANILVGANDCKNCSDESTILLKQTGTFFNLAMLF